MTAAAPPPEPLRPPEPNRDAGPGASYGASCRRDRDSEAQAARHVTSNLNLMMRPRQPGSGPQAAFVTVTDDDDHHAAPRRPGFRPRAAGPGKLSESVTGTSLVVLVRPSRVGENFKSIASGLSTELKLA